MKNPTRYSVWTLAAILLSPLVLGCDQKVGDDPRSQEMQEGRTELNQTPENSDVFGPATTEKMQPADEQPSGQEDAKI